MVFEQRDVRMRAAAFKQRAFDFEARGIGRVQHAPRAMSALACERDGAVFVAVESSATVDELANAARTFTHTQVDDDFVTEPGAGDERVAKMCLERVVFGEDTRDAPLSPSCVGLVGGPLGDDEDAGVVSDIEGKSQPSDSAADDEKVG